MLSTSRLASISRLQSRGSSMADRTVPVSLKPKNGIWRGMSRQVSFNRGDGRFRAMVNGYISPDGAEIRTFPGWKCVVNPDLEAAFDDCVRVHTARVDTVNSFVKRAHVHGFKVVRGRIVIVGESDHRRTGFTSAALGATIDDISDDGVEITITYSGVDASPASGTPGVLFQDEWVYFEDVVGTFAVTLNNLWHRLKSNATSTVIVIDTTIGGSGGGDAADSNGVFYKSRPSGDDPDALTTWTIEGPAGVTTPVSVTYPSMVANRQRDWGQLLSSGAPASGEYIEGHRVSVGAGPVSRRKQKALPYRTHLDVAGDRILIAAPGYGCVFQAPSKIPVKTATSHGTGAGIPVRYNDIYDQPRSLGVPKAVAQRAEAIALIGGSEPQMQAGTYRVKIAFRDQGTGEEGLPSEEMEVTIAGGSVEEAIQVDFIHPAYYFSETLALSVVVYVSHVDVQGVNYQGIYDMRTDTHETGGGKHGLVPTVAAPTNIADSITLDIFDSEAGDPIVIDPDIYIDSNQGPDVIAQMPMGCKALRTIRGVTFFGGHIGDTGLRLELQHGTSSGNFAGIIAQPGSVPNDPNWDDPNTIANPHITQTGAKQGTGFNVAHNIIPPAYSGQILFSPRLDNSQAAGLYPAPTEFMRLDKMVNCRKEGTDEFGSAPDETTKPEEWYVRWKMSELVHRAEFAVETQRLGVDNAETYLTLPRGHVWWSEAGFPGVSPAVNRQFLDAEKDEDIEAIGRMANSAIFCTRTQTFALSWANNPLGANPILLSSQFGCIAASSMVEFDGGLAWLSDRGPVALTGVGPPEWIGREVEALFTGANGRYLRDDRGIMNHAWAAHDPERGLVLFGLRSDRLTYTVDGFSFTHASQTDEGRSRFPCDEVLVWSYRNNAWSVWQPPVGLQIFGMERIECDDGVFRMAFLAQDDRIYALDDAWADSNSQPIAGIASADATASTTFTSDAVLWNVSGIPTTDFTLGNFVRVGMSVYLVNLADSKFTFGGETTIVSIDSTTQLTLADALTWKTGDVLYVGTQTMRLETFENLWQDMKRPVKVQSSAHRFSQNSTFVTNDLDSPTLTETTFDTFITDGRPSPAFLQARDLSEKDTEVQLGGSQFRTMGHAIGRSRQARTERGTNRGQEHRLEFTYYSGQQMRINDIEIELGIAGS